MKEDNSGELQFAQSLEKVRRIGREQGNRIDEEQVREAFAGQGLEDSQLRMVLDYLAKQGIGVGEPTEIMTEEERDYLQNYLDGIAALPVYGEKELEGYAIAAMEGDERARKCLAESFLRDVVDIAKLYVGQGVFLEDLIGEGNVALSMELKMLGSTAGESFKESVHTAADESFTEGESAVESKLSTDSKLSKVRGMLARKVMDAMEEFIRENAANERADKKAADRVNLVADKAKELAEDLRRKVTPQELAKETGLSLEAIQDALRISGYRIEDILAWEEIAVSGVEVGMQKTVYEDYKYSMQDMGRIYVGCKYSFRELLDEEEVMFKFRMITERYILPEADLEDTLETHLYYLDPGSFLVKLYTQLRAKVKVNVIDEKKRRYVTKQFTIDQLVKIPPQEKERQGFVVQELSVSKLALLGM